MFDIINNYVEIYTLVNHYSMYQNARYIVQCNFNNFGGHHAYIDLINITNTKSSKLYLYIVLYPYRNPYRYTFKWYGDEKDFRNILQNKYRLLGNIYIVKYKQDEVLEEIMEFVIYDGKDIFKKKYDLR